MSFHPPARPARANCPGYRRSASARCEVSSFRSGRHPPRARHPSSGTGRAIGRLLAFPSENPLQSPGSPRKQLPDLPRSLGILRALKPQAENRNLEVISMTSLNANVSCKQFADSGVLEMNGKEFAKSKTL